MRWILAPTIKEYNTQIGLISKYLTIYQICSGKILGTTDGIRCCSIFKVIIPIFPDCTLKDLIKYLL